MLFAGPLAMPFAGPPAVLFAALFVGRLARPLVPVMQSLRGKLAVQD